MDEWWFLAPLAKKTNIDLRQAAQQALRYAIQAGFLTSEQESRARIRSYPRGDRVLVKIALGDDDA